MSNELLPELPRSGRAADCTWDYQVIPADVVEAYGQACYEAGRRSVDLEQFRPVVEFFKMAGRARMKSDPDSETNEVGRKAILEASRLLALIEAHKPTNGR